MRDNSENGFRDFGPLGADNMRRQQGRSWELRASGPGATRRERVIYTGGLGKGNKGKGDAYASACTIACSIIGRGTVRGTIEWGTDGHANRAQFDWLHGTQIHVSGSAFDLIAELIPDALAQALDEDVNVTVGASIGYWSAGRLAPTLTEYIGAIDATPVELEVPAFAGRLHVASIVAPLVVGVRFLTATGGVALSAYSAADFVAGASVPVPNGATVVELTAGGGGGTFAAIFGLSL